MLNRILLTTDAVGGVWTYSIDLASGLAARRIAVVLAVLGPDPDATQRKQAEAIPGLRLVVTHLPLDWLAETPDQLQLASDVIAALASKVDVDTVHLHAPALVGTARWPVPIVVVAHSCVGTWWRAVRRDPMPPDLIWRVEATRLGLMRADKVVAPSASFASALSTCYEITGPIEIVLNARTPRALQTDRQERALTAGRLWDEGKNIATLDRAAGRLPWPVLAAGPTEGANGTKINCEHLRLLGTLDAAELAEQYAGAAVFVSVSRYEPFGLTVLEAAQSGCALVLSDIPTFRELWDGAATFVQPDEPDQIAAALEELLLHPDFRTKQGAKALQRAASFDIQTMIDATSAIHNKAASRTCADA